MSDNTSSPYSRENRKGKSLQEIRCPWPTYDTSCESWKEGGFHPIPKAGLFGPTDTNMEHLQERLDGYKRDILDEGLTLKYRDLCKHRIQIVSSWIRQLKDEPGAIPEAAGREYREYVEGLRKAQVQD